MLCEGQSCELFCGSGVGWRTIGLVLKVEGWSSDVNLPDAATEAICDAYSSVGFGFDTTGAAGFSALLVIGLVWGAVDEHRISAAPAMVCRRKIEICF